MYELYELLFLEKACVHRSSAESFVRRRRDTSTFLAQFHANIPGHSRVAADRLCIPSLVFVEDQLSALTSCEEDEEVRADLQQIDQRPHPCCVLCAGCF